MAEEPHTNSTTINNITPQSTSSLSSSATSLESTLGSQSTIELPQVAVVGSQSSGKSSVLEALTKRKQDGTSDEEYGEFLHLPREKFYEFSDSHREIQWQQMGVEYTFWQMLHLCISPKVVYQHTKYHKRNGTIRVVTKCKFATIIYGVSSGSSGPGMTKFTIALREIDTYKEVFRSHVVIALTRFYQHPVFSFVCTIYSLIYSVSETRKNAIKKCADVAEAVDDAMKKTMDTAWSAGKQATKKLRDTVASMKMDVLEENVKWELKWTDSAKQSEKMRILE
ncbi:hypothetical protein ACFE04_009073 [Oxalis oulophora]